MYTEYPPRVPGPLRESRMPVPGNGGCCSASISSSSSCCAGLMNQRLMAGSTPIQRVEGLDRQRVVAQPAKRYALPAGGHGRLAQFQARAQGQIGGVGQLIPDAAQPGRPEPGPELLYRVVQGGVLIAEQPDHLFQARRVHPAADHRQRVQGGEQAGHEQSDLVGDGVQGARCGFTHNSHDRAAGPVCAPRRQGAGAGRRLESTRRGNRRCGPAGRPRRFPPATEGKNKSNKEQQKESCLGRTQVFPRRVLEPGFL